MTRGKWNSSVIQSVLESQTFAEANSETCSQAHVTYRWNTLVHAGVCFDYSV